MVYEYNNHGADIYDLSICLQDFSEYSNFEECLAYIEDYMVKNGPFDGFLGHSQVWLDLDHYWTFGIFFLLLL